MLCFFKPRSATTLSDPSIAEFVDGFSIEVLPRTAARVENFRAILPAETRIYISHIGDTPIEDMVKTAWRLTSEGFDVMPHIPARLLQDESELEDWVMRYRDVGVSQALLLAGGLDESRGKFDNSMEILDTGLFDKHGFVRLHVAGHPEGNKDIDKDGSDKNLLEALRWKHAFSERTDAKMALVTQFVFEAQPVIDWSRRLTAEGIDLPVHVGVAGPAKLQTLIKYAIDCGVGPSLRVLQRRAMDMTKLLLPFEPDALLAEFAAHKIEEPNSIIEQVHFFPLGGITKTTDYTNGLQGPVSKHASASM